MVGPRNLLHSFAADADDPTEQPRWGKIGKQKIVDEGPLPPHPIAGRSNMETIDEDILDYTEKFIDKAEKDKSPSSSGSTPPASTSFPHLSPKNTRRNWTPENQWYPRRRRG